MVGKIREQNDRQREVTGTNKRSSINTGGNKYFLFCDLKHRVQYPQPQVYYYVNIQNLGGTKRDVTANQKDLCQWEASNLRSAKTGYTKDEIVASVIRSMHTDLRLKIILEKKNNLILGRLKGYLKRHDEMSSTDL